MKIFRYISVGLLIISQISAQTDNQEFRATWVITWEHINPDASTEANMTRAKNIIANHAAANMNAILWQARQSGTAYYQSSYEPWGYYAGYDDPGYDPLALAIEEAHARGLELHAWFNVFASSSIHEEAPAIKHPTWVCHDGHGNPMPAKRALSPGLDSVRTYLVDVAMEIVNNYDIDGLHLDYVRWSEYTTTTVNRAPALGKVIGQEEFPLDGMITQAQLEALATAPDQERYLYDIDHPFNEGIPDSANGQPFPSWEEWWRWCVTDFVQTLHDSIQAVKPWVRLSPAALGNYNWGGWQGYGTVYQDAALWFNEGYIEQLTPMHYHWTTGAGFTGMLTGNGGENWKAFIQPGINDGRLFSVGPPSYILHDQNRWGNHRQIVDACRTVPWVDGFQFFSSGQWDLHQYWQTASETIFPTRTKVRGTGPIDQPAPAVPSIAISKVDSLSYQLSITPVITAGEQQWLALYRSESASVDSSRDLIVDLQLSDSTIIVTDTFTGLQDFNGQYTYAATALNRYWGESVVSSLVITDSIPSFPPTVASTYPAPTDILPVNGGISIAFSKTMHTTATTEHISLLPDSLAFGAIWTEDRHLLFITPAQPLDHETAYTLWIRAELRDINGVALDGNSDGLPGDDYSLTFITQPPDYEAPVIVTSRPATQDPDSFEVAEIITIIFDEQINPATVSDTIIHLLSPAGETAKYYSATTHDDYSLLSVQPAVPLTMRTEYTLGLDAGISDTLGNTTVNTTAILFVTRALRNASTTSIDNFSGSGDWKAPGWSGSTNGILAGTKFGYSAKFTLPAAFPLKAGAITYVWDTEHDTTLDPYMLREYLGASAPKNVALSVDGILQCYVYGDGSGNTFRFCLDDGTQHEVSRWLNIDWVGWRLLEWDLDDPASFGTWPGVPGNGVFDSPGNIHFDSFQLSYLPGISSPVGAIYLDDLRVVTKTTTLEIADTDLLPAQFSLGQNYPNPFNPTTRIPFSLPRASVVELVIYDLLGREIITLVNGNLNAGQYSIVWHGRNGRGVPVASGIYFYTLVADHKSRLMTRRMTLLK